MPDLPFPTVPRCPVCGAIQVKLEVPLFMGRYPTKCDRCGVELDAIVTEHVSYTVRLTERPPQKEFPNANS